MLTENQLIDSICEYNPLTNKVLINKAFSLAENAHQENQQT